MKPSYHFPSIALMGLCTMIAFSYPLRAQNDGLLYGSTSSGGHDGLGTIVQLDPVTGHSIMECYFPMLNAGEHPMGELVMGDNGKFYGMTCGLIEHGSVLDCGAIYEWDPSTNTYTKKTDFDGLFKGRNPVGTLTLYNGKFYGMTMYGGKNDLGVIFEWDPATNYFVKKFDFDELNGTWPRGYMTPLNGKLYGVTQGGGAYDEGVIFEWDPLTNIFTKKIDFDGTNGSWAIGSLTYFQGAFYGMTVAGGVYECGVLYMWDPLTNNLEKKIDLDGTNRGKYPYSCITFKDGKGYGMTRFGGINNGGVIFEWDPQMNIFSKKIDLSYGLTGDQPMGSLTIKNEKLYGMAPYGGAKGGGVIFEWDPSSNSFVKKIDLDICTGSTPFGSLTLSGGKFYGTTYWGAQGGLLNNAPGALFEWNPDDNSIIKKVVFKFPSKGYFPCGELVQHDGKLFGMTPFGGLNGYGTIFEWDPALRTLESRVDFTAINGQEPYGSLTSYDGKLYGMTTWGGVSNKGTIFSWNPSTEDFTKILDFDDTNGSNPQGSLVQNNGKFFGMTYCGGSYDAGILFEWDPVTNIYTKKIELNQSNGCCPNGFITFYGEKFYGMTTWGGSYGKGVIFEWDPLTNIYTKKFDFDGNNGSTPYGSLIIKNDKLFGMTSEGGKNNYGVLFEWDPATNVFSKLMDFDGALNGRHPYGSLAIHNEMIYGMTMSGGLYGKGVIFRWDATQNIFFKLKDLDNSIGSYPYFSAAFTQFNGPFPAVTWTGNSNSDWYDPSNWTPSLPNSCTPVTIPEVASKYPTLNQIAACSELTLEKGASFIGSEFLKTGNARVFLDLPANEYHYLSSPVQTATFNDLFSSNQSGVWAYLYDEPSGNWLNRNISDSLIPGQGFSVKLNQPQLVRFEGSLNNSAINLSLQNNNSSGDQNREGWNLVGNPFTSAILWDEIIRGPGVEGAVYAWTGTNYISYIGGIGSLTDGIIPANNGFFVKTGVDGEALSIPLSARIHSNIPFYKDKITNLLDLTVKGNSYSDETYIHFDKDASAGFDPGFDARKLWGLSAEPQIYSKSADIPMSVNTLPLNGNEVIPIGFRCGASGTYSMDFTGLESFEQDLPVWLEDVLSGDLQNIRSNPVYNFDHTAGADENRFRLHFRSGADVNNPENIRVYSSLNTLIIQNTQGLYGDIFIFDLSGRKVFESKMSSQDKSLIPLSIPSGCYVVTVRTEMSSTNTKVIFRQVN